MQDFYQVDAKGTPRGGLVLLHEAFGLTPHIRRQSDAFAALGYTVIAPDMLDHAAPVAGRNPESDDNIWQTDGTFAWLPQKGAGLDLGRELIVATDYVPLLSRIQQHIDTLHARGLPVATIGYCWGGSMSFLSAQRLKHLACAVSYYGGRMAELAAMKPKPQVPVLAHLAKLDRYIPFAEAMKALKEHTPGVEAYGYDADHGFNRDDGPTWDAAVARVALERTLGFLDKHLK